jgi:glycosyltransferase involved in cell wall biosynthesis
MKKALILNTSFFPSVGGVENSLRSISNILVSEGWQVDVISLNMDMKTALKRERYIPGIDFHGFKGLPFPFYYFACMNSLQKLKKNNYDLVLSRSHVTTLSAIICGYKDVCYLVPGVVKYQNKPNSKFSIKQQCRYLLEKFIQKQSFKYSKLFAFSTTMEQQIQRVLPSANVSRVAPGVDDTRFYSVETSDNKKALREKLALPVNKKIILLLGRLSYVKGFDIALSALPYLSDEYAFVVVGEGAEKRELEEIVGLSGCREQVFFVGETQTPEDFYKIADLFFLSSRYEPFGQVLLESIYSNTAVLAFDDRLHGVETASRELFKGYETLASFCNSFSASEIANSIKCCINNKMDMAEVADFKKKYSWKKLIGDLIKGGGK